MISINVKAREFRTKRKLLLMALNLNLKIDNTANMTLEETAIV